MNFLTTHSKVGICLILALVGGILGACQAPKSQCCRLEYGLLGPSDLNGKWELVDTSIQVIQPTGSRYDKFPVSEITHQHLISNLDGINKAGVIIHDIRRYAEFAPLLGALNYKIDAEDAGMNISAPSLPQVGQSQQTQCLTSESSPSGDALLVCIVEVRYEHMLSTMFFYFDGLPPNDAVESLINQALKKTDGRIEEIDQHLGKSDG